jgi:hypothetical protein
MASSDVQQRAFDANGFPVKNLPAGVAPHDAVRIDQLPRLIGSGAGTLAAGAAVGVPFSLLASERPQTLLGGFAAGQAVELGFGLDLQAVVSNPGAVVLDYILTISNNTDNSQAPGFPVDYTYLIQGIKP